MLDLTIKGCNCVTMQCTLCGFLCFVNISYKMSVFKIHKYPSPSGDTETEICR